MSHFKFVKYNLLNSTTSHVHFLRISNHSQSEDMNINNNSEEKKDLLKNINSYCILVISKVGDRRRGRPEGSLFNSYYTEV